MTSHCSSYILAGFSTAFYVLGLLACTCRGADILNELGWESVRHKRTERWPVQEDPASHPPLATATVNATVGLASSGSCGSLANSVKSEGRMVGYIIRLKFITR